MRFFQNGEITANIEIYLEMFENLFSDTVSIPKSLNVMQHLQLFRRLISQIGVTWIKQFMYFIRRQAWL